MAKTSSQSFRDALKVKNALYSIVLSSSELTSEEVSKVVHNLGRYILDITAGRMRLCKINEGYLNLIGDSFEDRLLGVRSGNSYTYFGAHVLTDGFSIGYKIVQVDRLENKSRLDSIENSSARLTLAHRTVDGLEERIGEILELDNADYGFNPKGMKVFGKLNIGPFTMNNRFFPKENKIKKVLTYKNGKIDFY